MVLESDIFRTANLLITEYGEMAPVGANIRADQLRDQGDIVGNRMWLKIARITEGLLSETRPTNTTVH